MKKIQLLGVALVLLLVPFVLISIGTTTDNPAVWWAGLAMLVIGALIPPATRFIFSEEEDKPAEDESEADREDETDDRADASGDDAGRDGGGSDDEDGDAGENGDDDRPPPPSLEGVSVRPIAHEPDPQRPGDAASPAERQARAEARAHEKTAESHRQRAEAHREDARAEAEESRAAMERARAEAERARRRGPDPAGET
jgi:hypothetical protein